jgi:5-methylcytosine-specific restriction endonuclease McrA
MICPYPASLSGEVLPGMMATATALNSHVLVLNKLWMAVRVIDARRAFSLLVRDLAEVIRIDDGSYAAYDFESWTDISAVRDRYTTVPREHYEWVRTVRMEIAVPKVIRLLGYDRLPKQDVKLNRRNIFARDRNVCQYCGRHYPTSELSLDHVMPRSQGGTSTWTNLVCACTRCNAKKGGRTPEQAHMKLIRQPVKPTRNPVITMRLGSDKYAGWKHFLDQAYWSVELK